MSGFMICGRPMAKKPYYIQEAGLHIYSEQELCYFIYHNLMMIDDSFVSDGLIHFLDTELGMTELAKKLRKWEDKLTSSQLLLIIMQESDYYGKEELEQFRRQLEQRDMAQPYDMLKSRADYMVKQKRYVKAVEIYRHILEKKEEWEIPRETEGALWHNQALAQAGMFWMQEAADSFVRSYRCLKDSEILKEIFYLRLLEPGVEIPEEIAARIPAQQQYRWKEEYEVYDRQASNAPQVRKIDSCLKKDRYRRQEETEKILNGWKQEYRQMVL